MQDQRRQSKRKTSAARKIVGILYWVAILAGIWFAWVNINPYAQIVKMIAGTAGGDNALFKVLGMIPIINGIISTLGIAFHWFMGTLIWFMIQTLEIFRIVLRYDRAFTKAIIEAYQESDRFDTKEEELPAISSLKKWYNNFPWLTIARARNYALFAYGIDLCICLFVYPPVEGGLGELMYVLYSGQLDKIEWNNVILLLFTLFIIEAIVHLLFWLDQVVLYMRIAHLQGQTR